MGYPKEVWLMLPNETQKLEWLPLYHLRAIIRKLLVVDPESHVLVPEIYVVLRNHMLIIFCVLMVWESRETLSIPNWQQSFSILMYLNGAAWR